MTNPYPLAINFRTAVIVHGGRYHEIGAQPAHKSTVRVKMAAEINLPCEISVPTVDYQTPKMEDMHAGICEAVLALAKGKRVVVGCMGGIGRTGLFLACLAKAVGQPSPVAYVRANYYSHAIETEGQLVFVDAYQPTFLTRIAVGILKARALGAKAGTLDRL